MASVIQSTTAKARMAMVALPPLVSSTTSPLRSSGGGVGSAWSANITPTAAAMNQTLRLEAALGFGGCLSIRFVGIRSWPPMAAVAD